MHNVLWVPCPQFKRLFKMKEQIFPTCIGDDGQRIYLICSPSPILDLS